MAGTTVTPSATTPAQPSPKRKPSTAGFAAGGRTVKRRASKACHCCRARKVRCDVVESGTPCTNCRLDQVECLVSHSKRRKKSNGDDDVLNHSPISSTEDTDDHPAFPNFEDDSNGPVYDELLGMSAPNVSDLDLNHHVPHMLCMSPIAAQKSFANISFRSNARPSPDP